jgi:molecular chaperone DnaK (HSP70)
VLSANKIANIYFEFLDEFALKVERETYEERCAEMFSRATKPIEDILSRNNLTIADID